MAQVILQEHKTVATEALEVELLIMVLLAVLELLVKVTLAGVQ